MLRIKSGLPKRTPTVDLLKHTSELSVQQLTAFLGLVTAQKAIVSGKPLYLAERFKAKEVDNRTRSCARFQINSNLSIARGSYFYRTGALLNLLPNCININSVDSRSIKNQLRCWVKENINAKP